MRRKILYAAYAALILAQSRVPGATNVYQEPLGAHYQYQLAVAAWQYVGVRFEVTQPTHLTALHTVLGDSPSTFFAALVPLPGVTSLPQGAPFNAGEVTFSTVFQSTWDFLLPRDIPFDVTIGPGAYGLVLGGGQFGSSGYLPGVVDTYELAPQSTAFAWVPDSPPGLPPWHDIGYTFPLAVEGTAVPEPGLVGVLAMGAGIWACLKIARAGVRLGDEA
jgi:hypothetical protein